MTVVAFDALGTLFDLGDLEPRMAKPLHHATSLTLAGEWLPFNEIVEAVDPELAKQLRELDPFPDAREALGAVDEAWVLTNGGKGQTRALLERAGLDDLVAEVRSVEEVKAYKPHPDVYRMLPRDSKLIAAHAWDVAGARAAGYDAVWVNRCDQPWPFPGIEADRVAPDLLVAVEPA
jgi:2-haloacid dehalogenase